MSAPPQTPAIPRKLRLLQALDRRLGPALLRLARPAARELAGGAGGPLPAAELGRILVIRPGGLGDAILLRPMLAALRAAFPAAELDVLAERRNAGALRIGEPADTRFGLYCYDEGPLAVLRRLRARRFDLVIDTEQYHHFSILLANRLRPRWLCGFDSFGRGKFQTHRVPHAEDTYEAVSFLRLAAAVTGRALVFDAEAPFIVPATADVEWARAALAAAAGRPVAVVMPAAGGSYRLWPAERYAAVARSLAERGWIVAVLGGADAVAAGRLIVDAVGQDHALDLTGRTTLAQTAAVLARASLAVCADTGVLHLAYAVGTPTVSLFGPGLYRKWAPPGQRHRVVRKGLACSPCIRFGRLPPCPFGIACMRDITVAEVTAAVAELIPGGR